MGTGGRAAGQAAAPGVWASMEGRGPGPSGGKTQRRGCSLRKGCPVGRAEEQLSPESGLSFVFLFVKGRDSCLF